MFGFLKTLLRKLVETPVENEQPPAPENALAGESPAWGDDPVPEGVLLHREAAQQQGAVPLDGRAISPVLVAENHGRRP